MLATHQFELLLLLMIGQFIFLASLITTLFIYQMRDKKAAKYQRKDMGLKAKAPYERSLVLPHRGNDNQSRGNQVGIRADLKPEPSVEDILQQPPNPNMFTL